MFAQHGVCRFNSLQVGSQLCCIYHNSFSRSKFQFLIGRLATRGLHRSPFVGGKSFNSLQVGSQRIEEVEVGELSGEFQFLIGRLATPFGVYVTEEEAEFQFLIGRLATFSITKKNAYWNLVSIPYRQARNNSVPGIFRGFCPCFNSLQVGSQRYGLRDDISRSETVSIPYRQARNSIPAPRLLLQCLVSIPYRQARNVEPAYDSEDSEFSVSIPYRQARNVELHRLKGTPAGRFNSLQVGSQQKPSLASTFKEFSFNSLQVGSQQIVVTADDMEGKGFNSLQVGSQRRGGV